MSKYAEFAATECSDEELRGLLDLNRKRYDMALRPEARAVLYDRIRELEHLLRQREA